MQRRQSLFLAALLPAVLVAGLVGAADGWAPTGGMGSARAGYDVVRLPNGEVLITGGLSMPSTYLASCERYGGGVWTPSAAMNAARAAHAAVVLADGRVLACGGVGAGVVTLDSAEVYDRGTNTWTPAAPMTVARHSAGIVLLDNGKVLVAGGRGTASGASYESSAEVYDQGTNTWTATANSMSAQRTGVRLVKLVDGRVLAIGGSNASTNLMTCDIYNPATNTWAATGSLAQVDRPSFATRLDNGKVLAVSGVTSGTKAELYNPGTGTWAATGDATGVTYPVAGAKLLDGKVLVGGKTSAFRLFDPATGTWSSAATGTARGGFSSQQLILLEGGKVLAPGGDAGAGPLATSDVYTPIATGGFSNRASMGVARFTHTVTLLPNGKVLVAGGFDGGTLASAELYDPGTNTWSSGGSLATARYAHTAVLLPNGKVLVAGGYNSTNYFASAELYDPGTNTWSAAGSLATTRGYHTATVLPNGKVLVAGGFNSSTGTLASAEIYDPGTNAWSAAGSLATGRYYHSAALLPNGKVLVAGGYDGTNHSASAEVYDPGANSWSAVGSLATARFYHTLSLLPNGKVLAAGGFSGTNYLASAELFDPGTNTWSAAGSLANARYIHTASLLPSGKLLVCGGFDGITIFANTEMYDPGTNTWSAAGNLATERYSHSAVLLPSGSVLVTGGSNDGVAATTSVELYDPGASTFSAAGSLAGARSSHSVTLLPNGKVLAAGGFTGTNGSNPVATSEIFDPATNAWAAAGNLSVPRHWHTATLLPSGKVLVAGGSSGPGTSSTYASTELFDPVTNAWSAAGSLAIARFQHTATLLPNGKVLVAGGDNGTGTVLASAELYDPATNSWSAASSLASIRTSHTATLLPNGKVLIAGGTNGVGEVAGAEFYEPGTNSWNAAGTLTQGRHSHSATLLPNGKVLVAAGFVNTVGAQTIAELYNPATNSWTTTGSLAQFRYAHFAVLLPNGKVLVGAGSDGGVVLFSTELFDPGSGTWSAAGNLAEGHASNTNNATLLLNGKVLIASGGNTTVLTSAELYDPGLHYQPAWQPVINTTNSPISLNGAVALTGSRFKGISEASGGGFNNAATNVPIVQVRSLVNEQTVFPLPDPANPFSDVSFTSKPLSGFPPGFAQVTVFTNGIPSVSKIILVTTKLDPGVAWATPAVITFGTPLGAGQLNATAAVGGTFAYTPPAGTILNAGANQTLSVTFTPTNTDTHLPATRTVSITVLKATPVITWPAPADIRDGTALDGAQLNATANTDGTFAYAPPAGTVLAIGQAQTLSATFTPTDGANFTSATATVTINVLPPGPRTLIVKNTFDGGADSLRDCLTRARNGDTVAFDASVFAPTQFDIDTTISVVTELPPLDKGGVTLDARDRRVVVKGSGTPAGTCGLRIASDGNRVHGLTFKDFPRSGIILIGAASAKDNILGGDRAAGSGPNGLGLRMSGNDNVGVEIAGANADGNAVLGCWIGLDASGLSADGNGEGGVAITAGAGGNRIGGGGVGEGNVIGGNQGAGIAISGAGTDGNTIQGNLIGLAADGPSASSALPNSIGGVLLQSGTLNNKVGGDPSKGEGNTIAYNHGPGVLVRSQAAQNPVLGNRIFANEGKGIELNGGNKDLAPAVIQTVTLQNASAGAAARLVPMALITGSAAGDGTIEFFNDNGEQGRIVLGRGSVGNGIFSQLAPIDPTMRLTATFTDANGNTSPFAIYTGTPEKDNDGDGLFDDADTDDDNDGVPDNIENAGGSSPFDPNSRPDLVDLVVAKVQLKLSFKSAGQDSLTLSGKLPLADGESPNGRELGLDFGGFLRPMVSGSKELKLGKPKAGAAKYQIKVSKAKMAESLQDEGFTNVTQKKSPLTVEIFIQFDGRLYHSTRPMTYTAAKGKSGSAK